MKVVVVGSGLSAVGALKALIAAGVKPVVVDAGHKLELPLQNVKSRLSSVHPSSWSSEDLKVLANNKTSKSAVPKKLVMGSDYFYATDSPNPIRNDVFSLTSPQTSSTQSTPVSSLQTTCKQRRLRARSNSLESASTTTSLCNW